MVVKAGGLDVCIGGEWKTLRPGAGIRFAGDKAHAYRNSSANTVHFQSLIHYPKEKAASKPAAKNDDD